MLLEAQVQVLGVIFKKLPLTRQCGLVLRAFNSQEEDLGLKPVITKLKGFSIYILVCPIWRNSLLVHVAYAQILGINGLVVVVVVVVGTNKLKQWKHQLSLQLN